MIKLRTRNIFVPGGQPEYTYVARDEHGLEAELRSASDNLCKLVAVTGPTKSGKSVLTKRVYPKSDAVWIDGGSVKSEDDLWSQVVDQLSGATATATTTEHTGTTTGSAEGAGEIGVPFLTKASGRVTASHAHAKRVGSVTSREVTLRAAALRQLEASKKPLVIDDFHYLSPELQGAIVRAVKALVFAGHPVVLLAIPHRRYDAVRVEREMTGRVHQIGIPAWTISELRTIPSVGLPLLNATIDDSVLALFLNESLGSPHLVQEFFREYCIKGGVEETRPMKAPITAAASPQDLLTAIAANLSRPVFDALARGPRERTKRLSRAFRDGRSGDIYFAVLNAIAVKKPGVGRLEYSEIRDALNELLQKLPQAHEISRVLEHMATIRADQEASAPVLDWDKEHRRLHITDPYFAFFLRWGGDVFLEGHHKA
ncbi:MAG TPA: hypothetical protein VFY71_02970 [Planctomycetota bacterium]|nr:hypothetical protein [Planctomycetota bacterium]